MIATEVEKQKANGVANMDLFTLEKKYPALSDVTINHIKAWPFLRILIGFELTKQEFRSAAPVAGGSRFEKIKRIFGSLKGWGALLRSKNLEYLVFTNFSEARKLNGTYYDRLFHSTISQLGEEKGLIVNYCEGRGDVVSRAQYKNVANGDLIGYICILLAPLVNVKISEADDRLLETVLKDSQVNVDLKKHFRQFVLKLKIYSWLFKKFRPQVVLNGCYTYFAQAYAAKKLGIPVIEYQHGLVYDRHVGYRTELPYNGDFTADYFFGFGDYILGNIDESVIRHDKIRIVGFSYLELIEQGYYDKIEVDGFASRLTVVIPIDSVVENELVALVADIAPQLRDVKFILAARATVSDETRAKISDVENVVASFSPFQALVQLADFNLTIASTCSFEALYFGVPNLLYNANGLSKKVFEGVLSEDSYSFYFDTPAELVSFLQKENRFDETLIRSVGKRFYSHAHSREVEKALSDIL